MNRVYSDEVSDFYSLRDSLEALHVDLCAELGIEPAEHLIFEGLNGLALGWCAEDDPNTAEYEIAVDVYACARHGYCPLIVMAHETYHLYQMRKGLLTKDTYKGKPCRHWESRMTPLQCPWERAANRYESKIAKARGLQHPRKIKHRP